MASQPRLRAHAPDQRHGRRSLPDARSGEGGLLTSYVELGGSHDSNGGRPDGLAGMGFLRLSSSRLEGMVSARINTENWTPVGHTTPPAPNADRRYRSAPGTTHAWGPCATRPQLNVTGYPTAWLPVTALFTRQRAWLARRQRGHGRAPARHRARAAQQGGAAGHHPAVRQHRARQSQRLPDAPAARLGADRLRPRAAACPSRASSASTCAPSTACRRRRPTRTEPMPYGDRVRLMRLEGKLSPTVTESINALFRSRDVGRQTDADGAVLAQHLPLGAALGRAEHHHPRAGAQAELQPVLRRLPHRRAATPATGSGASGSGTSARHGGVTEVPLSGRTPGRRFGRRAARPARGAAPESVPARTVTGIDRRLARHLSRPVVAQAHAAGASSPASRWATASASDGRREDAARPGLRLRRHARSGPDASWR